MALPVQTALAAVTGLLCSLQGSSMAQSAPRGQMLFETRCAACHSLDANRVGPALRGVVGRVAGRANEFEYSNALAAAEYVWDASKLNAWLTDPESVVPGQAMNYRLDIAHDREDVVAYLASTSLPLSSPKPRK